MNTFRTSLPRALKATQAAAGQRLSSTPLRQAKRAYASASTASTGSNAAVFFGGLVAGVLAGGAGYYATATQRPGDTKSSIIRNANKVTPKESSPPPRQHATDTAKAASRDYQKVYNAIAQRLIEMDEYDDGSYGPVLVRLAWHASGTFDKETGTGGSNGATMRFPPEGDHGANAGLRAARDFLEPVKEQFPWIHYSDLWILAGICAFQEMQGPTIPWRPGRSDRDVSFCTPDGRLPDGSKEHDHLRAIFYRMGFDDREIVALSGAHALGRCHTDRSGFDGPWTFSPTTLTNDYYKLLLEEKWSYRKWVSFVSSLYQSKAR